MVLLGGGRGTKVSTPPVLVTLPVAVMVPPPVGGGVVGGTTGGTTGGAAAVAKAVANACGLVVASSAASVVPLATMREMAVSAVP